MSKKLKITYLGNFKGKYAELHENRILEALKSLGYIVYDFDINEKNFEKLLEKANKSDIFLFHNGGVSTEDNTTFYMGLSGLQGILSQIKCRKVFWFLDRVMGLGDVWADTIIKEVDFGFFNDDTWVRRHKYANAYGLHLGTSIGEEGSYREDLACDIAFIGRVYGGREKFVDDIKGYYGKKFKVFGDIWGKDFDDLCKSAKIIIQPKWLQNDFLWTDNIYRIIGAGGFLLHPRLQGLLEEGFVDGSTFVGYFEFINLLAQIDFFLKPENEVIKKAIVAQGKDFVMKNFTWEQRLRKMIDTIKEKSL